MPVFAGDGTAVVATVSRLCAQTRVCRNFQLLRNVLTSTSGHERCALTASTGNPARSSKTSNDGRNDLAHRSRKVAPSIIFIDEIEVVGWSRNSAFAVGGAHPLGARTQSSEDRHRALDNAAGVATTCVTGTSYAARARSTTSNRCQTEYSGGNVAITIWSGWNVSTPSAKACSGR